MIINNLLKRFRITLLFSIIATDEFSQNILLQNIYSKHDLRMINSIY